MGIQNNLKICDSSCLPWKFLWLRNTAWDFWGVLFEALGIFWGFDFSPHSIIIVTRNPEYPPPPAPLGLNCYQGLLPKMTTILVFQQYSVGLNYMYTVLLLRWF